MKPIIAMNHSPKTEEPESQPLSREIDLNVLHQELCDLLGDDRAKDWYYANASLLTYSAKCAAYVEKINSICEALPVRDIDALVAMVDDDNPPLCRTEDMAAIHEAVTQKPDPRTRTQQLQDMDDAETAATREADRP